MNPESDTRAANQRLIVASNRLPVVLDRGEDGEWTAEPGSGGLVTAMRPVLQGRGGMWVGWPGADPQHDGTGLHRALEELSKGSGYQVHPVLLTDKEKEDFYLGFSNQVIWPLFHDFQTQCNFDPRFWETYRKVNRKFAEALKEARGSQDFIWVHDYHLMGVAEDLETLGVEAGTGFFLHIPFPHLDLFVKLPWRFRILRSLLKYDLIGFQTARDRSNFLQCVDALLPQAEVGGSGKDRVRPVRLGERVVRVGVFPISIDFDEFASEAASSETSERAARLRAEGFGRRLILGVDRLDYSKGIPHKLKGYRLALERYPDLRERVTLVQLVVPSREDIPEYERLKMEVERLVGSIQGEFTRGDWVPIHYQYGHWDRTELLAHYREAAVALVTPLKDGMNLVAKEYCASSLEGEGVLILSEYAGATAQLQGDALLVNPFDVEGVAEAIHEAATMPREDRRRRMGSLRRTIKEFDLSWWVDAFLQAASDEGWDDLPPVHTYQPQPPSGFFSF